MKPVVCFFKENQFLYSEDYELLTCSDSSLAKEFLEQAEISVPDKMKIIQVSFDAFSTLPSDKPKLYSGHKALIYILNHFEIIEERELLAKVVTCPENPPTESFHLLNSKVKFMSLVENIKSMISKGRFYQVNLTSAFRGPAFPDSWSQFLSSFHVFQGRYKAYLPTQDYSILSYSPELFLEKTGTRLKSQPIKGSSSPNSQDGSLMLASEKEQAELSMIVDLLRNDLNSLSSDHAAIVTKHREIMKLNYIHHTYSEVQIQTEKNLPDILEKLMPGGSISGCPKKESLLAIKELENYQRQAYTGTIGWWKGRDFGLNITIRSFVATEDHSFYFAGCGIVYDSDPAKEFTELINKVGVLNVEYE